MFIPDEEKSGRKAALQKLMDLMGKKTGERLGSLKKPMSEFPDDEMDESDDGAFNSDSDENDDGFGVADKMDDNEPSEEEKAKIAELYHKYC